jgi:hypothetical protein
MPDRDTKEKNKNKIVRMSDMNMDNRIDIWKSKNSFMPSPIPLPSLMKKFGDQIKGDKKKRDKH